MGVGHGVQGCLGWYFLRLIATQLPGRYGKQGGSSQGEGSQELGELRGHLPKKRCPDSPGRQGAASQWDKCRRWDMEVIVWATFELDFPLHNNPWNSHWAQWREQAQITLLFTCFVKKVTITFLSIEKPKRVILFMEANWKGMSKAFFQVGFAGFSYRSHTLHGASSFCCQEVGCFWSGSQCSICCAQHFCKLGICPGHGSSLWIPSWASKVKNGSWLQNWYMKKIGLVCSRWGQVELCSRRQAVWGLGLPSFLSRESLSPRHQPHGWAVNHASSTWDDDQPWF